MNRKYLIFQIRFLMKKMESSTIKWEAIQKKNACHRCFLIHLNAHMIFLSLLRRKQCRKPRVIHSKNKLKRTEVDYLKRAQSGQQYICGSVFSGFDREVNAGILSKVFVREKSILYGRYRVHIFFRCNIPRCVYTLWFETKPCPRNNIIFPRCASDILKYSKNRISIFLGLTKLNS